MEESKQKLFKNLVKGAALLLCALFFILPLVQGTRNGLTASGFQIATGTGTLFETYRDSAYSVAFLLLIAPIILLILAFIKTSFNVLGIVSIIGLIINIIFIVVVDVEMRGSSSLTVFSWFVIVLYIGLCVFTFYCAKLNKSGTT